jgi:hypothetical protein
LIWHEIVNDEIGDKKVSVTFCPLCGSAVVFDRELDKGLTTLGVSGFLIESNMVMYDRDTESLWQQSTGESIAGDYLGTELEHEKFQLLTIGEVKNKYPNAIVLSDDTGFSRDYSRNPYSGYGDNDRLLFDTSSKSNTFEMKEIMVVFKIDDNHLTIPMNQIGDNESISKDTEAGSVNISKKTGEIFISDSDSKEIPFYFEMWFSVYAQHGEELLIIK